MKSSSHALLFALAVFGLSACGEVDEDFYEASTLVIEEDRESFLEEAVPELKEMLGKEPISSLTVAELETDGDEGKFKMSGWAPLDGESLDLRREDGTWWVTK